MRLGGREWRTLVSTARLGGDEYRVIRPERPPAHASLHADQAGTRLSVDGAATLSVDKTAAVELVIAWWLASRSPRSMVHLPLRSSPAECGGTPGSRRLDLVLLHHSLGFRVSQWKEVRSRTAAAKVHKVVLPPGALPEADDRDLARRHQRGSRDRLDWRIAADTLFIVGSRFAFELEGRYLRALAEEGPAALAQDPTAHCCAQISLGQWHIGGADRRGAQSTLHVECCNRHW
jgi:hypothetical protein